MIVKPKLDKNFTIISNNIARNRNLTSHAKAATIYIASLPNDKLINIKDICKELNVGKRTAQYAIQNLVDEEIIKKIQYRNEKGQFTSGFSIIFINNEADKTL